MTGSIKVILKQTNQVKSVSRGYAFNYLFPQGLAIPADKANLAKLTAEHAKELERQKRKIKQNQAIVDKLDGRRLVFNVSGDSDSGKLHRSITKIRLARRLNVDKKYLVLDKPIKKAGSYQVEVKLGQLRARVKVVVKIKK